jgi:hypothetical protein
MVVVTIPDGQGAIIEDWTYGCPSGSECEGVWFLESGTVSFPPGVIGHLWVFANYYPAETRFPSHACEYVARSGHDNRNIRVPSFGKDENGDYLEGVSILNHPGCPLP